MRKKKVLMQAHASNKKKIEIQMSKEKKQLRDLVSQKREYSEQLNSKSDLLLEKTQEIAYLIERAKKTSDR